MSKRVNDLTGLRFGRLTVIKRAGSRKKSVLWLCQCDCGKECLVRSSSLLCGITTSCGCFAKEKRSEMLKKYNENRKKQVQENTDLLIERNYYSQLGVKNKVNYMYHSIEIYKASLTMSEWMKSLRKSFALMG